MKNLAFVTLIVLAFSVANGNSASAEGFFDAPSSNSVYVHAPVTAPAGNTEFFASNSRPTRASAVTPTVPDQKFATKTEGDENGDEVIEPLDTNKVYAPPMTETFSASDVEDDIAKCAKNLFRINEGIKRYCVPNTIHNAYRQCEVWKQETNMCENNCPVSSAGAQGACGFMPDTFYGTDIKTKKGKKHIPGVGVDGDGDGRVDINNFYDNMESSIRYLCNLERIYGEDMYRAYNGGGARYKQVPATIEYDRKVRERSGIFAERIKASGLSPEDMSKGVPLVAVGKPIQRINFTFPIKFGRGCISSIPGEYRAKHPNIPHQGDDVDCEAGEPIYAAFAGRIVFTGHSGSAAGERAGYQVQETIGSGIPGTLGGARYFHMGDIRVSEGQLVNVGDLIGYVGTPGEKGVGVKNSGAHLHFEVLLWSTGHRLTEHDNPCQWVDCSGANPAGSLFVSPANEQLGGRCTNAKKHLLHLAGIK
jgi:murein DD-endopeptidase MepM/ murein hydrolase activator NlpD